MVLDNLSTYHSYYSNHSMAKWNSSKSSDSFYQSTNLPNNIHSRCVVPIVHLCSFDPFDHFFSLHYNIEFNAWHVECVECIITIVYK